MDYGSSSCDEFIQIKTEAGKGADKVSFSDDDGEDTENETAIPVSLKIRMKKPSYRTKKVKL